MNDSSTPSIRWWPAAVIVLLTLAAMAWIWGREAPSRQPQVLATLTTLTFAAIALFLWAVLLSRLAGRIRLGIFVGAITAGLLFLALFRIEGVSGDLLPILSFRYAGDPDFAESIDPANAGEIAASPTDFPQFLGPHRDGVIDSVRLARDWQAVPPRELWRHAVGDAWSSFVVVGGAALTQEQRGDEEMVVRYDLETGKSVWTHSDPVRFDATIGGVGPRATPTIVDGRVYTLGAMGVLNALDLEDGSLLWSRDVLTEQGANAPEWGKSNSPLAVGNLIIVAAGGAAGKSLAAYDQHSGEPVWTGGSGQSSYASPVYATLGGVPQVLNLNHLSFDGHDPTDGRLLWSMPWENQTPTAAQPLKIDDERVLISAGYGIGSRMYRVTASVPEAPAPDTEDMGLEDDTAADDAAADDTAADDAAADASAAQPVELQVEVLWEGMRLKSKFANMVLHEGTVYGLDDGIMTAIDPETGERLWKRGRYGHGQILLVDDLILIQAESGEVVLVEANPEKLVELARFEALAEKTWNPLALSGKYLLVRNHREAACYELPLAP